MKAHPRYAATPLADLGAHLAFDVAKLTDDDLVALSWSFGRALDAHDIASGEPPLQSNPNLDKLADEG